MRKTAILFIVEFAFPKIFNANLNFGGAAGPKKGIKFYINTFRISATLTFLDKNTRTEDFFVFFSILCSSLLRFTQTKSASRSTLSIKHIGIASTSGSCASSSFGSKSNFKHVDPLMYVT